MACPHIRVASIRLVTQLALFVIPGIHPWIKVFLILLTEGMDSVLLQRLCKSQNWEDASYAVHDKANDLIGYILCIILFTKHRMLAEWKIGVLIGAVGLRALQIPFYFYYSDMAFVMFPDAFKELLTVMLFIGRHNPSNIIAPFTLGMTVGLKAVFEYHFHIRRITHSIPIQYDSIAWRLCDPGDLASAQRRCPVGRL